MGVGIFQIDMDWLHRWLRQRRGGGARKPGNRKLKPRMTPEAARLDHRQMLRFMALNAAVGVLIGVCVGAALIFLDIGGLGARIGRAGALARAMGCAEDWIGLASPDGFDWRSL